MNNAMPGGQWEKRKSVKEGAASAGDIHDLFERLAAEYTPADAAQAAREYVETGETHSVPGASEELASEIAELSQSYGPDDVRAGLEEVLKRAA